MQSYKSKRTLQQVKSVAVYSRGHIYHLINSFSHLALPPECGIMTPHQRPRCTDEVDTQAYE